MERSSRVLQRIQDELFVHDALRPELQLMVLVECLDPSELQVQSRLWR